MYTNSPPHNFQHPQGGGTTAPNLMLRGGSTSPNVHPQYPVQNGNHGNFSPPVLGSPPGDTVGPMRLSPDNKYSGDSVRGYRPSSSGDSVPPGYRPSSSGDPVPPGYRPSSSGSAGYRLATQIVGSPDTSSEPYLEPRSSAGSSYQYRGRPHDSGVDIDTLRDSGHHDNISGSDQSVKGSVSFNPNGGSVSWSGTDPKKDPGAKKDPQRPESLAYRAHDYEELPMNKPKYAYADIDERAMSNSAFPGHMMNAPHDNSSQENLTSADGYRRRQNPLYGAVTREDSKASNGKKSAAGGCTRCLCISIVILSVISGIALILALVAMSGAATWTQDARTVYMVSTPSYSQLQDAMNRIQDLETRYDTLLNQYTDLLSLVGNDTSGLVANVSVNTEKLREHEQALESLSDSSNSNSDQLNQMQDQVQHLNTTKLSAGTVDNKINEIESDLSSQNTSLEVLKFEQQQQADQLMILQNSDLGSILSNVSSQGRQLANITSVVYSVQNDFSAFRSEIRTTADNISKMPGPQGPPGAGNLSLCEHQSSSSGSPNGDSRLSSQIIPSLSDNNAYVILGIECTTTLAKYSYMEPISINGFQQYRCVCSGTQDNSSSSSRFCLINYWRCPRIS